MQPVYGSNAYKYEITEQHSQRTQVKKQKKVSRRPKKAAVRSLLLTALITLLAFCLLGRNAQIIEQSGQIAQLQKDIAATEAKIIETQFEMEKKIDLNAIESKAINLLGMQRPEKAQIVYIDMHAEDYTEGGAAQNNTGVISAFIKRIWNN
ncbi:MAG: hypothetical protein IKV89_01105 [Clostridia bacterium]|nr:hypothetical protein [Clostridia bacterium]